MHLSSPPKAQSRPDPKYDGGSQQESPPGPLTYSKLSGVYDYFVELIPRKRRLVLLLNLDFDDCDDPSQLARDTTETAFIVHASETGGVLFSLSDETQIASAMHVVRQAYENVSE